MSRKRLGRLQRTATIVPLAVLSAAWTASVAGIGGVPDVLGASAAAQAPSSSNGPSVPGQEIRQPASLSTPGSLSGASGGASIVAAASTNDIPAAALAAYQRAESVINTADKTCKLPWQLIAAIGKVESNHGRSDGNVLSDKGVATPGIYGPELNGKHGTKAVSDTDAGQYDNDPKWDRAVGPMQFLPSTWSIVGVDANGDNVRNPQDINDAALAAAVYLCSGTDDLSTLTGQKAAVYRYDNNKAYVALVLKVMNAYEQGNYSSVPNNTTAAGYIVPGVPNYNPGGNFGGGHNHYHPTASSSGITGGSGTGSSGGSGTGSTGSTGGGTGGSKSGNSGVPTTAPNPVGDTVKNLNNTVNGVVKGLTGSKSGGGTVGQVVNGLLGALTPTVGKLQCNLVYALDPAKKEQCLASYGG